MHNISTFQGCRFPENENGENVFIGKTGPIISEEVSPDRNIVRFDHPKIRTQR